MPLHSLPRTGQGDPMEEVTADTMAFDTIEINNATATKLELPGATITERSMIIVQNFDDSGANIYLGNSDVQATGAHRGLQIQPGAGFVFRVPRDIEIYAITTASTFRVMVLEAF